MTWLVFAHIIAAVMAIALFAEIGRLLVPALIHGEPLIPKRKVNSKTEKTTDEMMREAIDELRSVPGAQEWAEEQARIAGFNIPAPPTPQQIRTDRMIVPMTGGSPTLFPTENGLLEINGTWYEKWITDKGSYLKEVEPVTVRDMSGKILQ